MSKKSITFGSYNIPNEKNEDRGSMYIDHKADGCPNIASFAIFDGHNGSMAASTCSQHFNRRTVKRISKLLAKEHTFKAENFSRQDEIDAIVCESIRLTSYEVDGNIRTSHQSGCTMSTLFLISDPTTGSIRAYNANVGDSRCVMYTPAGSLGVSEDMIWATEHDTIKTNNSDKETNKYSSFQMSEDHKLSLYSERQRIQSKAQYKCVPLPSDVMKGYMMAVDKSIEELDDETDDRLGFIELGYPSLLLLETASMFVDQLTKSVDVAAKSVSYCLAENVNMVSALDQTGFYTNTESTDELQIIHQESFISRRKLANGDAIGPEAIFSRYNLSINMTRSIGDKYAARCVIPIPDISVVNIPNDQFARFIIASDGVWDVMSVEDVRKIAFYYASCEETAILICHEAQSKRLNRRMRMDDISAITIDINPHLFPVTTIECCIIA